MVQLAADVVAELPKPLRQTFTIVACSNDASSLPALAAGTRVVSLAQCVAAGDDLEGCLMVAGPLTEQLDDVMRLLAYWRGPGAIALNADWGADSAPVEQVAFIKSFEAIYCFLPLVVKVLFIGQEGAVFKWVTGGNPAAAPWRIFGKEKNRLAPIGRMQHRPSNADLETVFYNAYAANNPVNKGIKALRSMVGGDRKDI
ncbi:hypothetical protein C2E20_6530 [Micractinium conductrix]|uniref:DUF1995 domain-containing protein n=1 Tax=Micractinium conductrix TaxID=554055 RepID=A0A2P6V7C2_9CHLO|nr:hypothetical protein C2E20_6533 [Micractinium conductrix]PSC70093.1 hypothetical protein C2E20_6530 [Micractinium conductrix]|eukprot:PSC69981.1 hypothetical protein C2E20_6533 [Micractinium conductrix]